MKEITISTPSMSGRIYIGNEVLTARLPDLIKGQKNFVVTDSNVYALYGDVLKTWFLGAEIFVLPAGEEYKNLQSLYSILEKMVGAGLHRTSRLFAVGGGVVGDIAGLAAALFMRGISCVQIPTTLLSQIDSSVGGKTAVDVCGVKNVVGAFYQPMEVLVDLSFLKTLPAREWKCGLGEMIKYVALNGQLFDAMRAHETHLGAFDNLTDWVEQCILHKVAVVEADEKESGERKSLNVGHTTGHAIELCYGLSHGESVLYGMWLETYIAMQAGVCEQTYGEQLLHLIACALNIQPVSTVQFTNVVALAEKTKLDKKNSDDGQVVMSVAKRKNEWSILALPFEEYVKALSRAMDALSIALQ